MASNAGRGTVFVLAIVYYTVTSTRILYDALPQSPFPGLNIRTVLALYLILGASVSRLSVGSPKPVKALLSPFLALPNKLAVESTPIQIIQLLSILVVTKLLVKAVLLVVSLNIVVLFKSTVLTTLIVQKLAHVTPVILILMLPLIKKGSWYYFVAYCTVCGGTALFSGLGIAMIVGLIWRNFVILKWTVS